MAKMTVAALGGKVDGLTTRVDGLTTKVDGLAARFDEHEKSNEREFQAIQETFGEMRAFMADQFLGLRTEMNQRFEQVNQRFDRVDRRFDRVEDKLDRALSARGPTTRSRRRRGK